MAMYTTQILIGSRLEETGEHLTCGAGQPEDHGTFAELSWGIPRTEQIVDAGVEAGPMESVRALRMKERTHSKRPTRKRRAYRAL